MKIKKAYAIYRLLRFKIYAYFVKVEEIPKYCIDCKHYRLFNGDYVCV